MKTAVSALMAWVALAEPGLALDIKVQRDEQFDFGAVATYAWRAAEHPEDHPVAVDGPYDRLVRGLVDHDLQRRGFERVEAGAPDVWVAWDGVVHPDYELEGVHVDLGPVTWVGHPQAEEAYAFERGTLFLAVVDAATEEVVWRGLAADMVELGNTAKVRKKIEKAARRLLGHLPGR